MHNMFIEMFIDMFIEMQYFLKKEYTQLQTKQLVHNIFKSMGIYWFS